MRRPSIWNMVERISWFKPCDYEILLFFEDHDIYIGAKALARNIEYSRQYVSKRLNALADAGMLDRDGGLFTLNDRGREFLAGDLDTAEIESRG